MSCLRQVLRLIFALEALGLLSLAFLTLRRTQAIAAVPGLHLTRYSVLELFCFLLLMAVFAALPVWRLERGDRVGRWSALGASILNLALFPPRRHKPNRKTARRLPMESPARHVAAKFRCQAQP